MYPAYHGCKEVEEQGLQYDNGERWRTYWLVFGMCTLLESVEFSVPKVPFYTFGKLAILLWVGPSKV